MASCEQHDESDCPECGRGCSACLVATYTRAAQHRAAQAEAELARAVDNLRLLREARERLLAEDDALRALNAELAAALRELNEAVGEGVCWADCEGGEHVAGCLQPTILAALGRTPAAAAERVAAMEAALREALTAMELPEVTEESTDCPGCGAIVEWRGDYAPDIGDCVACDECVHQRRDAGEKIIRAALARLDAAGGDGDG